MLHFPYAIAEIRILFKVIHLCILLADYPNIIKHTAKAQDTKSWVCCIILFKTFGYNLL